MVLLKQLVPLDDLFELKQFYNRHTDEPSTPLITKLLVDNCVIRVSSVVLALWSARFGDARDENGNISLSQFSGCSRQVKECVAFLHGQEVKFSLENVQVLCHFGLHFEIKSVTEAVEKWLAACIKDSQSSRETRSSKRRRSSGISEPKDPSFVKILKIGLKIEQAKPKYDFIFELCSKEYEVFPDNCLSMMAGGFKSISKPMARILFRKYTTLEYSMTFLHGVPTSPENVTAMLEMLEDVISGYDICVTSCTEIISLLKHLANSELPKDTLNKLQRLNETFDQIRLTRSTQDVINSLIKNKPWKSISNVTELIDFLRSYPSIVKYMSIEIILDWLIMRYRNKRQADNELYRPRHRYQRGSHYTVFSSDKADLVTFVQNLRLNSDYMKDVKQHQIYMYLSGHNYIFDMGVQEYPEATYDSDYYHIVRDSDFSKNIWFVFAPDNEFFKGRWCKKNTRHSKYTDFHRELNLSLVPDIPGDKSTQLQVKINDMWSDQPCTCCVPVFLRWNVQLRQGSLSSDYISSEVSTYQEMEDFIKSHPTCEMEIKVVCTI